MIEVLFFAELRDQAGTNQVKIQASDISVKQLKEEYLTEFDLLTINNAMIAVNEEYAEEDTILKDGDVVAFIPPVSGG